MSSARYVVVACTQKDRWFDLDSERGPGSPNTHARLAKGVASRPANGKKANNPNNNYGSMDEVETAGAPPLDCWTIDDDPPPTTEETPMSEARFIVSDVYEAMAKMPDNSVDLIVTSPPFLALRSYLPAGHPDKHKEIGSEPTPAAFLTTLLALTREWRRILTPTGSLCVELGDTYSGSGGAGGDYGEGGLRDGAPSFKDSAARLRTKKRTDGGQYGNHQNAGTKYNEAVDRPIKGASGWPLPKSLCLIPTSYAWALAYGHSPFDHTDQLEPWRVRNLIVWHRPNPPVGALGDKVRPSTSYVTVACTAKDRWFDLDSERSGEQTKAGGTTTIGDRGSHDEAKRNRIVNTGSHPAGAPPLDCWIHDDAPDADVWTIPTAPYAGAHYATFPPVLPRRLINLMCPRQVCVVCGEPRRRNQGAYTLNSYRFSERPQTRRAVVIADQHGLTDEHIAAIRAFGIRDAGKAIVTVNGGSNSDEVERLAAEAKAVLGGYFREFVMGTNAVTEPLGWSDCGHNTWRRGIVLDPFCGSGTTLQAASELGRDSIGIDLDTRNLGLARQRLGMFLVEEDEVVA